MQRMSLLENPVLTGAKQRMTGTQAEDGLGHGKDGTAKAAEAGHQSVRNEGKTNNAGSALRALGTSQGPAGTLQA